MKFGHLLLLIILMPAIVYGSGSPFVEGLIIFLIVVLLAAALMRITLYPLIECLVGFLYLDKVCKAKIPFIRLLKIFFIANLASTFVVGPLFLTIIFWDDLFGGQFLEPGLFFIAYSILFYALPFLIETPIIYRFLKDDVTNPIKHSLLISFIGNSVSSFVFSGFTGILF